MYRLGALVALVVGLAGCAQVQGIVADDVANAAALARAGGDEVGAGCWDALGMAFGATPLPAADRAAVVVERARLVEASATKGCAVVFARLLTLVGRPGL